MDPLSGAPGSVEVGTGTGPLSTEHITGLPKLTGWMPPWWELRHRHIWVCIMLSDYSQRLATASVVLPGPLWISSQRPSPGSRVGSEAFRAGNLVRADVPKRKRAGNYAGRVGERTVAPSTLGGLTWHQSKGSATAIVERSNGGMAIAIRRKEEQHFLPPHEWSRSPCHVYLKARALWRQLVDCRTHFPALRVVPLTNTRLIHMSPFLSKN
jgi:hypothetical protein